MTVLTGDHPAPQAVVEPSAGSTGTIFHLYSNNYAPGEAVVTWLNTSDGAQELDLSGAASERGEIWLDFDSRSLQPGSYSIVLYGLRTGQTGVVAFVIQ